MITPIRTRKSPTKKYAGKVIAIIKQNMAAIVARMAFVFAVILRKYHKS
jgi:hypothetical protein